MWNLVFSHFILIFPLLLRRPTVAPENTFAYTSHLQIRDSENEVSVKILHVWVSHFVVHAHTYTLQSVCSDFIAKVIYSLKKSFKASDSKEIPQIQK